MKKLFILLAVVAALILGYLVFKNGDLFSDEALSPEEAAKIQVAKEESLGIDSSREALRYASPKYGFSFEKPEGYTVGAIPDGLGGDTILVQNTATGRAEDGFQIYIYPAGEEVELTPQVIKDELPGTRVANAQKIELDGAPGMMFESNSEAFGGDSFEIWFVHDGFVYQISSYAAFSSRLKEMIGTWNF